jgi:uncharacterized membrane-anchored protein
VTRHPSVEYRPRTTNLDSIAASIRLTQRTPTLLRIVIATFFCGIVSAAALAAAPDNGPAAASPETRDQIYTAALREAIGAPARADIDAQATVRLWEGVIFVPREPAAKVLKASDLPVPPDFKALLVGSDGMDTPGIIRFVPIGFVNSDAALAWTADDMLFSLKATVEHGNPDRVKQNLQPREARRWILPPHYNPESHQIVWAALIVPNSAPRESDGEVTFHAIGFGREGYIQLTVATSVQKARQIGQMADDFLAGLNFRPGKAYGDAQPADMRAPGGLAGAMGIDALRKAPSDDSLLASDNVIPFVGASVASIGGLSLFIYIRRHLRRRARRN